MTLLQGYGRKAAALYALQDLEGAEEAYEAVCRVTVRVDVASCLSRGSSSTRTTHR